MAAVDFAALPAVEHDPDVIPCASETEARFITPDVDVGETIECTSDLMEDIVEAEENCPQGALKIEILEEDDVALFAENQYVVKDALCITTDVPELLEGALRAFQGRAFWGRNRGAGACIFGADAEKIRSGASVRPCTRGRVHSDAVSCIRNGRNP